MSDIEDRAIAEVVRERLKDECDGHEWRELESDVSVCEKCQTLRFANATMEQLERHLLSPPPAPPEVSPMSAEQGNVEVIREKLWWERVESKSSAEQGDVEVIREALLLRRPDDPEYTHAAHMALASFARLAAAKERAEREQQPFKSVGEWRSRAEQAELTLAFQHEATAEIEARAEKAERALAEIADGSWGRKAQQVDYDVCEFARAALRPSEGGQR